MTDDLDRLLRERARAARDASVPSTTDVEQTLADITSGAQVTRLRPVTGRTDRRWLALAGAAAAIAVFAGGAVWLLGGEQQVRTSDPTVPATGVTAAPPSSAPSSLPEVVTMAPSPSSEAVTTPTDAPSSTEPAPNVFSSVSYRDDLPVASLVPLGEVTLQGGPNEWLAAAIGDLGVVVRNGDEPNVHVLGFDGQRRDIPVSHELGAIAYGPGDILYALRWAEPPEGEVVPIVTTVAVPLSGADAGRVVAEVPALGGAVGWVETTPSPLAHGPTGIVDRERQLDLELLPYVGVSTLEGGVAKQPSLDGNTLVTSDRRLVLQIDREPGWTGPFTPAIPAVGAAGTIVYPTTLGAPVEPGDFAPGTMPVIMVASASGDVAWYAVPDGWVYATSDIWGTVFVRRDGDRLDVALLEVPASLEAPSPETTPPSTVTTVPPTLPPDPNAAVVLDGLYYEYAGFRNACDGAGRCTQVEFDPTGAPVTYDFVSRTVTRHMRDEGTVVQFTLPAEYGQAALMAAGPDRVVYFHVPTDDVEVSDAVALSIAAEDAGREIVRIPGGGYGLGDYDLVPTPEGLAIVGWYGQGWHPPADAHVAIEWIDRSGAPIISPQPVVEVDFYSHDVRIGDRMWSVGDLPFDVHASTPTVLLPTLDGGFVAQWFGIGDSRSIVVRGWADGTVEQWVTPVGWDEVEVTVDPTGHLLVPDGSLFERAELWPARPADYWDGALDEGVQAGGPLNVYLHDNDPWWEHGGVVEFANAVVGALNSPAERRTIEVLDAEALVVAVTTEGFLDDSVAGGRTVLDVASTPEGLRLESVEHTHACQPNRGHQDYSDDLCT